MYNIIISTHEPSAKVKGIANIFMDTSKTKEDVTAVICIGRRCSKCLSSFIHDLHSN